MVLSKGIDRVGGRISESRTMYVVGIKEYRKHPITEIKIRHIPLKEPALGGRVAKVHIYPGIVGAYMRNVY